MPNRKESEAFLRGTIIATHDFPDYSPDIPYHMKKILLLTAVAATVALSAHAQRISCTPDIGQTRSDFSHVLPAPFKFDPEVTYRLPVVLINFSDMEFSIEHPEAYYDRLFNEPGFNEGKGPGCVADYFRDQSGGLVNLKFDIYGPVKVDEKAGEHRSIFYGNTVISKAIRKLGEDKTIDFSIYDFDGDGEVRQVLFVFAGYTGNKVSGYTWPNTGFLFAGLPGGVSPFLSSITCEKWDDNKLCGIGTIIHELFHCLGLPDIYPQAPATPYSTVDEWDLMDGGNFTNRGWCPPSLTAMERMYLGWSSPVELSEPTSVEGMKPLSDGGLTYIVRSDGNSQEYYLLENRRQEGWDYGCPGNGLLIYHVDFDINDWRDNKVNTSDAHFRYALFHPDGKDYMGWDPANNGKDKTKYTMDDWMRSTYLSTSAYPYTDPVSMVMNDSLTDESSPAATLYKANANGQMLMGKPITHIRMAADGTISFNFMKPGGTGVDSPLSSATDDGHTTWYAIDGRRLDGKPTAPGIYIARGKKVIVGR